MPATLAFSDSAVPRAPFLVPGLVLSAIASRTLSAQWLELREQLDPLYERYRQLIKPCLPPILVKSLIAAEDHRFYGHGGVDTIAIGRAIWVLLNKRIVTGGSTIEQQLVRTVTGHYERRISRKLREMLLASLVSQLVPKLDIPGVYLSVAYFGWCMNGIEQACARLGIYVGSMTSRQAASLIARLKYPEPQHPSAQRSRLIATRTEHVLKLTRKRFGAPNSNDTEVRTHAAVLDY